MHMVSEKYFFGMEFCKKKNPIPHQDFSNLTDLHGKKNVSCIQNSNYLTEN